MARSIKKTTDKEAKERLKKSGRLKGLSRKEKKEAIRIAGIEDRQQMRAEMKAKREKDAAERKRLADKRREEARLSGQRLAYDVDKTSGRFSGSPKDVMRRIGAGSVTYSNDRLNVNAMAYNAAKPGEIYERIMPDGSKVRARKPKVRAVKKAPGGGAMKKMPTYADGGKLKEVPSDAKGLSKLPKSVRNKMGYAKHGSKVKAMYGAKIKKKAMYGAKMKK